MFHPPIEKLAAFIGSTPNLDSNGLCTFSAALDEVKDFQLLTDFLLKHRTALAFYKNVIAIPSAPIPAELLEELCIVSSIQDAVEQAFLQDLHEFAERSAAKHIEMVPLKSLHMLLAYPKMQGTRLFKDLDLLFHEEQINDARQMAFDMGYKHAVFSREHSAIIEIPADTNIEKSHYELTSLMRSKPFTFTAFPPDRVKRCIDKYYLRAGSKSGTYTAFLKLDLHRGLATNVDSSPIWARSSQKPNSSIRLMSPTDVLWYVAGKAYLEMFLDGYTYFLKYFYDLQVLIKNDGANIDYESVLKSAKAYSLEPALYYLCSHLHGVYNFKCLVPLIQELRSIQSEIDKSQDYGDFMPRMFDMMETHPLTVG